MAVVAMHETLSTIKGEGKEWRGEGRGRSGEWSRRWGEEGWGSSEDGREECGVVRGFNVIIPTV